MENVMKRAQALAEAIVESEIYRTMHQAETAMMHNEEANQLVAAFMEKRQAVEALLASNDMDHDALAAAGKEMEEAEKVLNENADVAALQNARRDFSAMMENVNRILRLVITGEPEEEHSCGGNCAHCSGCH